MRAVRALRGPNRRSRTTHPDVRALGEGSRASDRWEWQQRVANGGFQCVGRVVRDPNRICQLCRAGAGRKPCVGEAAPAVSGGRYKDSAAPSLSRIRVAVRARAHGVRRMLATAAGRTRCEASAASGICPEPARGGSRNLAPQELELSRSCRRFASDDSSDVRTHAGGRPDFVWRPDSKTANEPASTGLPERVGEERSGAREAGRPAARAPSGW